MKNAKKRGKTKRSDPGSAVMLAPVEPPPIPETQQLAELLEEISQALEGASGSSTSDPSPPDRTVFSPSSWMVEPCGPSLAMRGQGSPLADPLLLDRYQGLLVRSGVVGASVHHLPSRTRQRMEDVLRELVAGVARGRPATGSRVDALVADLVTTIGERIVCTVEDWRDSTE